MAASNSSGGSSSISRQLNRAQEDLKKSFEKLSSGKRINKASDDAAGLAIAEALKSDAVVLKQANRNISDGQSAIEIADSAISQVSDISIRMSELATQASNGTLNDQQREVLNNEFQQLSQEVQRISATTEFNGRNVVSGDGISIQAGTDASANSRIATSAANLQQISSQVASLNISSIDQARSAINSVKNFADSLSSARGELGSTSSRLQFAQSKNEAERVNSLQAESRIRDVDVAEESANNVAARIRSQTGAALSAQANLVTSRVLDLLR